MLKVLLVISSPYSSMQVLADAATGVLTQEGHDVYWVYADHVRRLLESAPGSLSGIDLIHFLIEVETFPMEVIRGLSEHVPIVTSYHHRLLEGMPPHWGCVDRILCGSPASYEELESLGILSQKIDRLFYGVDTALFSPPASPKTPGGPFTLGLVAYNPERKERKGGELLLSTAQILVGKGYSPRVFVVGYGWESYVERLRNMRLKVRYAMGVSKEQLARIYQQMDLFLITSSLEGGPLSLLEAGACGVPIVSTPVGLAKTILTQPGCGVALEGFSAEEMARAVMQDMDHRAEAQRRARIVSSEIRTHWDWKHTHKDLSRIYEEVVRSAAGRRGTSRDRAPRSFPNAARQRAEARRREIFALTKHLLKRKEWSLAYNAFKGLIVS